MNDELGIDSDREYAEVGTGSCDVGDANEKALDADDSEDAKVAARVDASPTTVKTPFSGSFRSALSSLKSGRNLVHQKAILKPLSTIRCLRMNMTTNRKKQKPERMSILSSQSAFSSAVISCFEVVMTEERVSCCKDVERREAVEESSIWVFRTDRSSSVCMRAMVRRRASVTSELAFIKASSLQVMTIRGMRVGSRADYIR
jgi:hypothetical protein